MNKQEQERKNQIDQMASKIFDYICTACEEEEANKRMMELSISFLTATLDVSEPMELLSNEILKKTGNVAILAIEQIKKIKEGNSDRVVSEFKRD